MASVSATKPAFKVLGSFGKGLDGSVSVNFDVSGGANCELACPHHPDSTAEEATGACYAVRTELRPDRTQLRDKLERHATMPAWLVCGRALAELSHRVCRGESIPWVRISTSGSVPPPHEARRNKPFRVMLCKLLEFCQANRIPVHLPVETYAKARYYRSLVGDLAVVRESATSLDRFQHAKGPVSVAVGQPGARRVDRVAEARAVAKQRREQTGRKTIVCPAILHSWASNPITKNPIPPNPRAKCGACVACALAQVDIVYPLH